jgi:hypothetical protein
MIVYVREREFLLESTIRKTNDHRPQFAYSNFGG